ncbi:hypothetical protein AS132_20650 [Photobacterium sanguinicancri]|nr:hypothetical protein AS132_20650 [Photobacterium sanguinicancri]
MEVSCLELDESGHPLYVLNPVLEIYSEPVFSIGDYDRIVMDVDFNWHWEHNEYYPEYYVGQELSEKARSGDTSWRNHIPPNFPDYIEPDDPIYGAIVNSLCWYIYASSFEELIESTHDEIDHLCNVRLSVNSEYVDSFGILIAFVNPRKIEFSPRNSISCERSTKLILAPQGYWHWLSVGYQESELFAHVFYPKRAKGHINVIVNHGSKQSTIKWNHGCKGLFSEEVLPIINRMNVTKFKKRERARFLQAIEDCIQKVQEKPEQSS